jgi:hypothetical protein
LVITSIDDDEDIDYEQLFDDHEIKKPVKRVRFAPIIDDNSLTPKLSIRPTFDVQFDFDSLASPANETSNWKDAFLTDLHIAKRNPSMIVSSPSVIPIENKPNEDTLWDFMKESNPELLEKLERTNKDKPKRIDRFSTQQPSLNNKPIKSIPVPNKEAIQVPPSKPPISLSEVVFKQPEPSNISIIEIRLENGIDQFDIP